MNYKPDESTLIAYLYGDLDTAETQRVKDYLTENPEVLDKFHQLADVRATLSHVQDKEVIAPPVFMDQPGRGNTHFWQAPYFRTIMSIAASFLFILIAARLIGPDISYSKGELRISFKDVPAKEVEPVIPPQAQLTPQEVQEMINNSLVKNNEIISDAWSNTNQQLQASFRANFDSNSNRIDELMKVTSQASQEQVRTFVASLQQENLQLVKDYLKLSSADQQVYVESLLVDFSKYLQEQRNQDLQFFQARMSSIEKNTDQFKQDTEQILANIISGPESSVKKVNVY